MASEEIVRVKKGRRRVREFSFRKPFEGWELWGPQDVANGSKSVLLHIFRVQSDIDPNTAFALLLRKPVTNNVRIYPLFPS